MQHYSTSDFARALADKMIRERFGRFYGTETFDSYLDLIDTRQTQHLSDGLADRVIGSAGQQRRNIELTLENAGTVIANIPMNDPRRPGAMIWAQTELGIWLDLMEMGANNAWRFDTKGNGRSDGQVRTNAPVRACLTNKNVPIARLIANAKPGQQARTRDHNALNLRRANVFLVGNPGTCEGRVGTAKTDSVALIRGQAALQQSLAGADYDFPGNDENMEG
jgi:hypothetical protein